MEVEREGCANVAEEISGNFCKCCEHDPEDIGREIEEAIRARGEVGE